LSLRKQRISDPILRRQTGLLWARASLRATTIHAFLRTARAALRASRR
jgi:hypothetical protein